MGHTLRDNLQLIYTMLYNVTTENDVHRINLQKLLICDLNSMAYFQYDFFKNIYFMMRNVLLANGKVGIKTVIRLNGWVPIYISRLAITPKVK